jgi:UDP-N-acetylmuramoyl-tripeptide--D-alanyl-D-alanine ligase
MRLALFRIAEFTGASGDFPPEVIPAGYSIDSRTIKEGELFIAVKGERLDGHDFVEAALKAGACAAIVSRKQVARFASRQKLMAVDDTLRSLQTIATATRMLWNKPLVGVTGSAGKTTTKDAIAHLLATRHRVLKSEGNLNNQFGLPLQLLKLEAEHDIAVIEMGMSRPGEIRSLAKIARPDTGVVTCVAPVHLEFFQCVSEIARAKFELIAGLHAGGIAVLNADDPYVCQFGRDFHGKVVTFGISPPADVRAEDIRERGTEGSTFKLVIDGLTEEVSLPLLGRHNVMNALAAVATALEYKVSPSEAAAALATLKPPDKRGEVFTLAGATIVNDCYNSNPTALNFMVDALAKIEATRRIVVAGEMLELGPTAEALHAQCGAHMAGKVDILIGVRGLAAPMVSAAHKQGIEAHFVPTPEDAGDMLANMVRANDAVLLKASRGVRLERALEILKQRLHT